MIPVFKPSMNEEEVEAVAKVIRSGWIGLGPETEKFEKKIERFLQRKHVVATNSATSALHLALIMAGVSEGDEVISPALTFVSTNHAILYQRAVPVFCDIDKQTLCADPNDIIKKITPKTKAILVVHYGGFPVDLDPILEVAKRKNITVIEDAAHAFGGFYKGKPLGTIGDYGCFSFHAIKGVAMADGGAVFTHQKTSADQLKKLRWMGISKDTWERTDNQKYSWYYNVEDVGYKYHPNDILSALGIVQLKKYKKVLKKKKELFEKYNENLKDLSWLELPSSKDYAISALHNYVVKVANRNKLIDYLSEKKIATTVHYVPNNHYKMYKQFRAEIPVTENVWKKLVLLPFYPQMTKKEQDYVITTLRNYKHE